MATMAAMIHAYLRIASMYRPKSMLRTSSSPAWWLCVESKRCSVCPRLVVRAGPEVHASGPPWLARNSAGIKQACRRAVGAQGALGGGQRSNHPDRAVGAGARRGEPQAAVDEVAGLDH